MKSAGQAALVRLEGASYRYRSGRTGVTDITLEVGPGERVVLMGPNGSGKTTVLRLIAGELRPAGGTVHVMDRTATRLTGAQRRSMGVAPAESVHLDALPARRNALFFARAAGLSPDRAEAAVDRLFERFGLAADTDIPPREYSYGMSRKLLLIEALAHEPVLLLLDEPTLGLDPSARKTLLDLLHRRAHDGASVVAAFNGPTDALALASRVVFLLGGRVVANDTPDALLARLAKRTLITIEVDGPMSKEADYPEGVTVSQTQGGLLATSEFGPGVLPALCQAVLASGRTIRSVRVKEPDLADVFAHLTGQHLAPPTRSGDPSSPGAAR
ncbi:MAG: ATP-binding cassette domain-containing protein [Gemmatimonadota bacterium]|nr:MAG: ATP-binding cassette domain-containing protein [Gemmatimonadota bacterium]